MKNSPSIKINGLCRFSLKDESRVDAIIVKEEIKRSFEDKRTFAFYPDRDLINSLKQGTQIEDLSDKITLIKNQIIENTCQNDQTALLRYNRDTHLSRRLENALILTHRAIVDGNLETLCNRRLVLIKELHGIPTIYHLSNDTTVLTHIGQGPEWEEMASVYLGLKTFDTISYEIKKNNNEFYDTLIKIFKIEERAIETGFMHIETYPQEYSIALNKLVDKIIFYNEQSKTKEETAPPTEEALSFTPKDRTEIFKLLNSREQDNISFNYSDCILAIEKLEFFAGVFKNNNEKKSLTEITKLLVTASGHDIHEVRNRANYALERIFSIKEYGAPLAKTFYNCHVNDSLTLEFDLDNKFEYILKIYHNNARDEVFTNEDITYKTYPLKLNKEKNKFLFTHRFLKYGHYDFLVHKKTKKGNFWINLPDTSGRINVMPQLQGFFILEIFTDIHGHTKLYWKDSHGHPGLVYNENGEVIRLGRFSDITFHLEDLKQRYNLSAIYLLGIQQRGYYKEDWDKAASSPSPFSPMSLTDIEYSLGGDSELIDLINKAHSFDIKIIVDIVPHLNRHSTHLKEKNIVYCLDDNNQLTQRSSTDGRFSNWNDGKLLNYRQFEIWQWLKSSIEKLISKFDIDGIRFDSAHSLPVMMHKNIQQNINGEQRTDEEVIEGTIITNEKQEDHFITTGYYDSQCRDIIANPFHQYLMINIERIIKKHNKDFFINIAECFWGHERFLSRSGLIPYNASLFKILEKILHGKSNTREIYNIYNNYYSKILPYGTELLGIFGNHDERRALNTFGEKGLRPAIALTSFMSNIIMDFEGSAEGEGWKVYLDNVFVNWNEFENASHRSVSEFYKEIYSLHKEVKGKSFLLMTDNDMVASAAKFTKDDIWLGVFSFSEKNEYTSIDFSSSSLPIDDESYYRLVDPIYSPITNKYEYFTGKELKTSKINATISYTSRIKILKLVKIDDLKSYYNKFLQASFNRLCFLPDTDFFKSNFLFNEIINNIKTLKSFEQFMKDVLIPNFWFRDKELLVLAIKRSFYAMGKFDILKNKKIKSYIKDMQKSNNSSIEYIGTALENHFVTGDFIFLSAEADPFSKSGGLANVVYELPRHLAKTGEKVFIITGYYAGGTEDAIKRLKEAEENYNVKYTGIDLKIKIYKNEYTIKVYESDIENVKYYLLKNDILFDGLYYGKDSIDKITKRVAFTRASAELINTFKLKPILTFTNDAYAGIFNGICQLDKKYIESESLKRNSYLHIIHNGGWQYFDEFNLYENDFNLFNLFNLPENYENLFLNPENKNRLNCMAAGIRFAHRNITVSPSYAKQIDHYCDGLESLFSRKTIGISNAIARDYYSRLKSRFDKSGFVKKNYDALIEKINADTVLFNKISKEYPEILDNIENIDKIKNKSRKDIIERKFYKMLLQVERGLTVDPDIVMLSMIHRITDQKGYTLLLEASEGIFKKLGFQAIIGGSVAPGDETGENIVVGLKKLTEYYPDQVNVTIGFQDVSVPLFASDIFCMPSLHEPGGISQLEAFVCGCLVVARATGGLRDTIDSISLDNSSDTDAKGNGFLFTDFNADSFFDAMKRAAEFFKMNDEDTINLYRDYAKKSVFYWEEVAENYLDVVYDIKEIVR